MSRTADILVVGGGVIGCAVARELTARASRTLVLDARGVARGATQASAGMLAPYTEAPDAGPLLGLLVRSLELYGEWIRAIRAESGLDVEYQRNGSLEVAFDVESADHLKRTAEAAGGDRCQWLSPEAARRLEPGLADRAVGALFAPEHGFVSAPGLTEALAAAVERGGGAVRTGPRVVAIATRRDSVTATLDDGSAIDAGHVVIATGSWTPQLHGLEDEAPKQMRPVRGQLLRVRQRSAVLTRVVWGPGCYLVPWADGLVLVGATMEDAGFEERNTVAAVRMLLEAAATVIPTLAEATFVDARAGLRPATADGLPIIGASASSDRVVYATGHFRNGILLAPLTARLVADAIAGSPDPVLDLLSPCRATAAVRVT